ncbi:uncharacterized protein VTP21DRAFT_6594 [Calcarisporiella thermophila]|uniref:uncharacterized protein n=1 Tax=Calcarisporiella thermophila TaxID=911321 RepID=UPI00374327BF
MTDPEVVDFERELKELTSTSASKIRSLTKSAIAKYKHFDKIAQTIVKHIQRVPPEYKLSCIYLIDSISRAAFERKQRLDKYGKDDLEKIAGYEYLSKFQTLFQEGRVFASVMQCSEKDKEKIKRVIKLWQTGGIYPNDILTVIKKAYFSDITNSPPTEATSTNDKKNDTPPATNAADSEDQAAKLLATLTNLAALSNTLKPTSSPQTSTPVSASQASTPLLPPGVTPTSQPQFPMHYPQPSQQSFQQQPPTHLPAVRHLPGDRAVAYTLDPSKPVDFDYDDEDEDVGGTKKGETMGTFKHPQNGHITDNAVALANTSLPVPGTSSGPVPHYSSHLMHQIPPPGVGRPSPADVPTNAHYLVPPFPPHPPRQPPPATPFNDNPAAMQSNYPMQWGNYGFPRPAPPHFFPPGRPPPPHFPPFPPAHPPPSHYRMDPQHAYQHQHHQQQIMLPQFNQSVSAAIPGELSNESSGPMSAGIPGAQERIVRGEGSPLKVRKRRWDDGGNEKRTELGTQEKYTFKDSPELEQGTIKVLSRTLYFGRLNFEPTKEWWEELLAPYGRIVNIDLVRHSSFVRMETRAQAERTKYAADSGELMRRDPRTQNMKTGWGWSNCLPGVKDNFDYKTGEVLVTLSNLRPDELQALAVSSEGGFQSKGLRDRVTVEEPAPLNTTKEISGHQQGEKNKEVSERRRDVAQGGVRDEKDPKVMSAERSRDSRMQWDTSSIPTHPGATRRDPRVWERERSPRRGSTEEEWRDRNPRRRSHN